VLTLRTYCFICFATDKDQQEPPPGCVASTALHKCEYAELKAKDIAADAGFQKALSKHRFRKSATTARLFLELLGDAGSSVVQVCVQFAAHLTVVMFTVQCLIALHLLCVIRELYFSD
jgi:hypothetical protein